MANSIHHSQARQFVYCGRQHCVYKCAHTYLQIFIFILAKKKQNENENLGKIKNWAMISLAALLIAAVAACLTKHDLTVLFYSV